MQARDGRHRPQRFGNNRLTKLHKIIDMSKLNDSTIGVIRLDFSAAYKKGQRLSLLAFRLRWRLPTLPLSQYHRRDKV